MKKNNPKELKRRSKIYNPPKKHNPVHLAKEIERINEEIQKQKHLADMREAALLQYIEMVTNFAAHDIKNQIHSLDGFVYTMDLNGIDMKDIDIFNKTIYNLRESIKRFTQFNPTKEKEVFETTRLYANLELLNRGLFIEKRIKFITKKDKPAKMNLSFYSIVMMFNNLINNSIKALDGFSNKTIEIKHFNSNNNVTFYFCDNGIGVSEENRKKIFENYFSTTGGTGIGLAHANFTLQNIDGKILLVEKFSDIYSTIFKIVIPAN